MYVADNFATAKFEWAGTRWRRRGGAPVINAELWKELVGIVKRLNIPVQIKWLKGKTSPHTKAVDKLAKASALQPFNQALSVTTVRRKTTEREVEVGSVRMEGQVLDIRVVTVQYLPVQRCARYRYQVVSEDSEFQDYVDWAFSDETLSAPTPTRCGSTTTRTTHRSTRCSARLRRHPTPRQRRSVPLRCCRSPRETTLGPG